MLFFGSLYNFIINIGDVLQIKNIVFLLPEIPYNHIKNNIGSRVPQMRKVVSCRTANKKIDFFIF